MSAAEIEDALYVDTSALARVLLDASDADAISDALSGYPALVASQLMRTELRRVALRTDTAAAAERILETVSLIPLTLEILQAAETVSPPSVATLDAIHLVTALAANRAGALQSMMTFDRRLADAATLHGLTVLAPSI